MFMTAAREYFRSDVYSNSYTKGAGLLSGIIGEMIIAEHLDVKRNSTKDYDLIKDGIKIEVKTKQTSVVPEPHYNCSIFRSSKHQKWDRVYFVRITYNHKKAYILGWMNYKDFYKQAKFIRRGELMDGNMKAFADCYNIEIKNLKTRWSKKL